MPTFYKKNGFTLIETLLYTAMVSMVVGALLLIVYNIVISREWLDRSLSLTENKKFLIQKIVWVLQNVSAVNAPAPDETSGILSVNKIGGSTNPIVVDASSGIVRITSGGENPFNLTTSDITASNILFEHASTTAYEWMRMTGELWNTAGSTTLDYTFVLR